MQSSAHSFPMAARREVRSRFYAIKAAKRNGLFACRLPALVLPAATESGNLREELQRQFLVGILPFPKENGLLWLCQLLWHQQQLHFLHQEPEWLAFSAEGCLALPLRIGLPQEECRQWGGLCCSGARCLSGKQKPRSHSRWTI